MKSPTSGNKGKEKTPLSSPDTSPFRRLFPMLSSPKKCSNSSQLLDDDKVTERVFNYFDENGDGKISSAELQRCMRSTGLGELTPQEAELAVHFSDSDEDGLLDFKDFSKLINGTELSEVEKKQELREVFEMYAAGGAGCITPKSLKRMLSRLGESPSVSICEAMIRKVDLNGDGVLSFDDFNNMMKNEH